MYDSRYYKKRSAPEGVHVPGKNEAKTLRKIMSQTGLSKEEINQHKVYRIELSEAQKIRGHASKKIREEAKLMKSITKELKLAKEHPLVQEKFKKEWSILCAAKFILL